jgi:hypothetical protein
MKIYISNILPKELNRDVNTILEKNNILCEINTYVKLVSKESGIFIIKKDLVQYIEPNFHPIFEQLTNYNNSKMNLLFDLTKYNYTTIVSRLPTEYIYLKIQEYSYKLTANSNLSLKIMYIEETDNYSTQLVPIDYYFEYIDTKNKDNNEISVKDLLSNLFFKNDFNMLLSVLN